MGLKKSFQIGRIAISHENPNIVYVGALGRLYGTNEERGLYKTTDAGQTWERVLYVDDKTGIIDVQMHPTNSDILLVAAWNRMRDGYDSHPGAELMADGYDTYDPIQKWGAGGGIYKTADGGKNWHRLTNGLPESHMGRVGLDFFRKNPDTILAIVDCEKIGMGPPPQSGIAVYVDIFGQDADGGVRVSGVRENGPSSKAGLIADDLVLAVADKPVTNMEQLTEELRSHKIGDKVSLKVRRGADTKELAETLERVPQAAGGTSTVYLGLAGEDVENGIKVTAVTDASPAEEAGLKEEDVVQSVGDNPVQGYAQLMADVRGRSVGDKVKLKILREDKNLELEVTLAETPAGGRGGGGRRGGAGGAGAGGGGGGRRGGGGGPFLGFTGEEVKGGLRITNILEIEFRRQGGIGRGQRGQTDGRADDRERPPNPGRLAPASHRRSSAIHRHARGGRSQDRSDPRGQTRHPSLRGRLRRPDAKYAGQPGPGWIRIRGRL